MGLVGESGAGKSTLARAHFASVAAGARQRGVSGRDLLKIPPAAMRAQRRHLQIVFQDPLASLNPRMTVGDAIAEPLLIFEPRIDCVARRRKVATFWSGWAWMPTWRTATRMNSAAVSVSASASPAPRCCVRRLLVCDEAVSSLDVSIQGQIVNLLLDLQQDMGMAMLFISHNLAVVRHLSHRVMVMYLGKGWSKSPPAKRCSPRRFIPIPARCWPRCRGYRRSPARPSPRRSPQSLAQESLAGASLARGCAFRDRCPYALPLCASHRSTALPKLPPDTGSRVTVRTSCLIRYPRSHDTTKAGSAERWARQCALRDSRQTGAARPGARALGLRHRLA